MKELQDQLEAETYFSVKKIYNKCFETCYEVFSLNDTSAILVSQNNEMADMLVSQSMLLASLLVCIVSDMLIFIVQINKGNK